MPDDGRAGVLDFFSWAIPIETRRQHRSAVTADRAMAFSFEDSISRHFAV
jgi:hypothetical protein